MGDIYQTANSVTVWLGDASDESDMAIDYLAVMGSDSDQHWQPTPGQFTAVLKLLARPGWKRLWTVQESVFAQKLWVSRRTKQLCSQILFRALDRYSTPIDRFCCGTGAPIRKSTLGMPMHSALKLNMMRGMLSQDNGYKPILEVLIGLYREHECTDPRDRIFRLLGLAEKNETLQITTNHGMTLMGLVPEKAEVGDTVALIEGCRVVYVLRRSDRQRADKKAWRFVGDADVEGVMFGEWMGIETMEDAVLV